MIKKILQQKIGKLFKLLHELILILQKLKNLTYEILQLQN